MFEKLNDNLNDCAMVTAEEVPVLQIEQTLVPSERLERHKHKHRHEQIKSSVSITEFL